MAPATSRQPRPLGLVQVSTAGPAPAIGSYPGRAGRGSPIRLGVNPENAASAAGLDEPDPDGVADQPGHVVDVEPVHELGPVGLDRLDAHPEEPGDRLRRLPLRDQPEHLALPGRQRSRLGRRPPVRRR